MKFLIFNALFINPDPKPISLCTPQGILNKTVVTNILLLSNFQDIQYTFYCTLYHIYHIQNLLVYKVFPRYLMTVASFRRPYLMYVNLLKWIILNICGTKNINTTNGHKNEHTVWYKVVTGAHFFLAQTVDLYSLLLKQAHMCTGVV